MASFGRCRSGLRWPLASWPAALSQKADQCPLLGTTERSSTDQLWAEADRPFVVEADVWRYSLRRGLLSLPSLAGKRASIVRYSGRSGS
jgi:hypothetical protein